MFGNQRLQYFFRLLSAIVIIFVIVGSITFHSNGWQFRNQILAFRYFLNISNLDHIYAANVVEQSASNNTFSNQLTVRRPPATASSVSSLLITTRLHKLVSAAATANSTVMQSFSNNVTTIDNNSSDVMLLHDSCIYNNFTPSSEDFYCSLHKTSLSQITTVSTQSPASNGNSTLTLCPAPKSRKLIMATSIAMLESDKKYRSYATPSSGGVWKPSNCTPRSIVAVIIPYRNRPSSLRLFVTGIHRFLQSQNTAYHIILMEQDDKKLFNRGKLLNIGFTIASREFHYSCFVFHDADKLPENIGNVYSCNSKQPRHMMYRLRTTKTKVYGKGILYSGFVGGVNAFTKDQFTKINGFSNRYFGWGREDDELMARMRLKAMSVQYNMNQNAEYVNLDHERDVIPNTMPWPYSHKVRSKMATDGLNSLKYSLTGVYSHSMFTLIRVKL